MKKILITGGAGLLGQNLVRKFLAENYEVHATQFTMGTRKITLTHPNLKVYPCDLKDYNVCLELCKDKDLVVHGAAYIKGAKGQLENPISLIRNNLLPTINIMEASCEKKVPKFAFIGSSTMYPDVPYPVGEDEAFVGEPPAMYTGVGWWKRYTEKMAAYYHKITSTKFIVVRTTAMYGPYDIFDISRSHVVPSLIMKCSRKDDPLEVWGNGTQVRDFIFIEDFVEGLMLAINKSDKYLTTEVVPINIASGEPTSIYKLVNTTTSAYKYTPTLNFNNSMPIMIHSRLVSTQKAIDLLGWRAKTTLVEGIKRTVEWYENEKENIT